MNFMICERDGKKIELKFNSMTFSCEDRYKTLLTVTGIPKVSTKHVLDFFIKNDLKITFHIRDEVVPLDLNSATYFKKSDKHSVTFESIPPMPLMDDMVEILKKGIVFK